MLGKAKLGIACPSLATLTQFARGELDSGLEGIAEHLSECLSCEQRFETIERDTIDECFLDSQIRSPLNLTQAGRGPSGLISGQWSDYLSDACHGPTECDLKQRIGRFKVVRRIGVGGFGQVFLAYDPKLRRHVAVKLPHHHRLQTPKQRQAFLREGQLLAKLEHPGLVTVHDVDETDDGQLFLVMEFIEGSSLSHALDTAHLTYNQRVAIAKSITAALGAAHQQGLVHRDLKPSNVLLRDSGQAVVADFGLASEIETDERQGLCGTPPYMAPELLSGEAGQASAQTDVWSLGVTLYRLFTGHRPYSGQAVTEVLEDINNQSPRPPCKVNRSMPAGVSRVVLKCLEVDCSKRYQSVDEVAGALKRSTSKTFVVASSLVVLLVALSLLGTWSVREYYARQSVDNLFVADLVSLPPFVERLRSDSKVQAKLCALIESETLTDEQEFRARLGSQDFDFSLEDFIKDRTPGQCRAIAQCLSSYEDRQAVPSSLAQSMAKENLSDGIYLRLATVLVQVEKQLDWSPYAARIVHSINQEIPKSVPDWFSDFRTANVPLSRHIVDVLGIEQEVKRRVTLIAALRGWHREANGVWRALVECNLTPEEFGLLTPAMKQLKDKEQFCGRIESEIQNQLAEVSETDLRGDVARLDARTARLRNLILALTVLDRHESLWLSLKDRREPSLRTSLIHSFAASGIPSSVLLQRLFGENSTSLERGAIVLGIAEYAAEREKMTPILADLYERDPDAYVHSAAGFALNHFGEKATRERLDASGGESAQSEWYRRNGHTFVRIEPGEENPYLIGRYSEKGGMRSPSKAAPTFYMSVTPVTIEQIRTTLPNHPIKPAVSDPKVPVTRDDNFLHRDAMQYCVELSKLDGLTPDEWCYEYVEKNGEQVLMPKSDFLAKPGYRLPTDAECVYAFSGGMVAETYFGSPTFCPQYEWRKGNAEGQRRTPALLRPNPLGLFDALGNVRCAAQDTLADYRKDTDPRFRSVSKDFYYYFGYELIAIRGGDHQAPSRLMSVDDQLNAEPSSDYKFYPTGFRVVYSAR